MNLLKPFKCGGTFSISGFARLDPTNTYTAASSIVEKKTRKLIQAFDVTLTLLDSGQQLALVGTLFEGATHSIYIEATEDETATWPKVQANADIKVSDNAGRVRYTESYDFQLIPADTV